MLQIEKICRDPTGKGYKTHKMIHEFGVGCFCKNCGKTGNIFDNQVVETPLEKD